MPALFGVAKLIPKSLNKSQNVINATNPTNQPKNRKVISTCTPSKKRASPINKTLIVLLICPFSIIFAEALLDPLSLPAGRAFGPRLATDRR